MLYRLTREQIESCVAGKAWFIKQSDGHCFMGNAYPEKFPEKLLLTISEDQIVREEKPKVKRYKVGGLKPPMVLGESCIYTGDII